MSKITKVCNTCWSTDISYDASAYWDIKKQNFIADDIHDTRWCRSCNDECRDIEFTIDKNGQVQWPTVHEVIVESEPGNIIARARVSMDEDIPSVYERRIKHLYKALLKHADASQLLDFVETHSICDWRPVEDRIMEGSNYRLMIRYIRDFKKGNTLEMFNRLLELATQQRDPSMLEDVIRNYKDPTYARPRNQLGIDVALADRMYAVYKLIGGSKY